MGKLSCEACKKKCKGQAIKLADDKFLHPKCFKCKECTKPLSPATFYTQAGSHYCVDDYQRLFGTKCHSCGACIEGEAVTALGKTYHRSCLRCANCSKNLGAGEKVTFSGTQCLCHECMVKTTHKADDNVPTLKSPGHAHLGDGAQMWAEPIITSTPARPQEIALTQGLLSSPDSDYSTDNFMSDSRSPMSPVSATSGYKSESFDQTMNKENGLLSPSRSSNKHDIGNDRPHSAGTDVPVFVDTNFADVDHKDYLSPSMHFMNYRSVSPGSMSRTSGKSKDSSGSLGFSRRGGAEVNYGKFYKTSFLGKKDGFKRGPSINPIINEKPQHHYHRPDGFSYRKVRTDILKPTKKGATKQLVTSRKKTEPYKPFKNQDAIQLSKIPDAQKYETVHMAPIERDDWPAPPAPAAAYPELLREHRNRRRSSRGDTIEVGVTNGAASDDKENRASSVANNYNASLVVNNYDGDDDEDDKPPVDPRIEKDIELLSKMPESGAAMIILEDLRKKQTLEVPPLDPRSASRTPSAATEPPYKTRYESSIFASPSRDLEMRARLPSMDETLSDMKYRTMTPPAAHFLSTSLTPRPGYGGRSARSDSRNGYLSDTTEGYFHKWQTDAYRRPESSAAVLDVYRRPDSSAAVLERSSCYSSQSDLDEYDANTGLRRNSRLRSTIGTDGRQTPNFHGRRSVPLIFKIEEPPKIYTYEQLRLGNRDRPHGIDEDRLEQNLSKDEFEALFQMSQAEFYHLAEWKRNDMKKRIELFQ